MMRPRARFFLRLVICWLAASSFAAVARSQVDPPPKPGARTATVAAGERYHGSGIRRFFMGDTYRDLWSTPVTVPVLDLRGYAGGLTLTKKGGGKQTKSLRFENARGEEFVFRLVDKAHSNPPEGWKGTVLDMMARDQVSAQHPAGAVVADVFMDAAGVLHPEPVLAVMPDDPRLGKYREEFAGTLGMIERYPNVPEGRRGFAGAIAIIDSDSLRGLLDTSPADRVDERAYLTARLVDMFINDWDRHPGNWKWARRKPGARWVPIARDRDKAMVSYGGLAALTGKLRPELVTFDESYPSIGSLTVHSRDLDHRLLAALDASAFDSIAVELTRRFSDDVIDRAVRAMPVAYHYTAPRTAEIFRARRDGLRAVASDFYRWLCPVVDIHATDANERATVTIIDEGHVEVEIRAVTPRAQPEPVVAEFMLAGTALAGDVGRPAPYYHRVFDAAETREIRLYMHGGDDHVDVRGDAQPAIRVRVIGGEGTNDLEDHSATGNGGQVRFYDQGHVEAVVYGPVESKSETSDDTPNFDRRPYLDFAGRDREVPKDHGLRISPLVRLDAPGDLGLVPGVGIQRVTYGFRTFPYATRLQGLAEYSTAQQAWRISANADRRREESELHWIASAHMSELEVLNFYGFGNDTPGAHGESFYEVDHTQWSFHPALALAVGTRSDVALGPVFKYSTTDSTANLLSSQQPYGMGDFGQAGIRLGLYSDSRDHSKRPGRKVLLDLSATWYPAFWDVRSQFGVLNAITATYITVPVPLDPVIALKAGGKKLMGDFPFHEAAFVGGRPSERDLPRERYAGDASLYGTAELRVPLFDITMLLPIDTGVYFYGDAGRVYMDGDSPGGWHRTTGVGVWIGVLSPAAALSVESDGSTMSGMQARIGLSF